MASPGGLGNGSAHRVADDYRSLDPQRTSDGGRVVSQVIDPCSGAGAKSPGSVGPVVPRDDPDLPVPPSDKRLVGATPVEVGAGRPAVEQQDGRPVGRTIAGAAEGSRVAYLDGAEFGKFDTPPRWCGDRRITSEYAGHRSMATTLTANMPPGASNETVSPTAEPSRAAPSGDPGETTSTSSRCSSIDPTSIRSGSSSPS